MRAGGDGVSIVGYSCRLPGATNPHEFWRVLRERRCTVSRIPEDRFATNVIGIPIGAFRVRV
jgi:acyl transferase domain-containing protein